MYSEKISMFSDRDGGWVRKFQSEPREETSVGWKTLENRTHIDRYHIHIYIYMIVFMKYHKEWEKKHIRRQWAGWFWKSEPTSPNIIWPIW